MTKLAHVPAVRQVSRQVSRTVVRAPARRPARKVDPAWVEFAEHILVEKLPFVAIGAEIAQCAKTGRFPLRAVLLCAALAI
jgi:hypothetical protein